MLIVPFLAVFIYAGIHEYRRYRSEGRATYGLVYDEETGTTHLTGIAEGEEPYNPEDFDPSVHNEKNADEDDENTRSKT